MYEAHLLTIQKTENNMKIYSRRHDPTCIVDNRNAGMIFKSEMHVVQEISTAIFLYISLFIQLSINPLKLFHLINSRMVYLVVTYHFT